MGYLLRAIKSKCNIPCTLCQNAYRKHGLLRRRSLSCEKIHLSNQHVDQALPHCPDNRPMGGTCFAILAMKEMPPSPLQFSKECPCTAAAGDPFSFRPSTRSVTTFAGQPPQLFVPARASFFSIVWTKIRERKPSRRGPPRSEQNGNRGITHKPKEATAWQKSSVHRKRRP